MCMHTVKTSAVLAWNTRNELSLCSLNPTGVALYIYQTAKQQLEEQICQTTKERGHSCWTEERGITTTPQHSKALYISQAGRRFNKNAWVSYLLRLRYSLKRTQTIRIPTRMTYSLSIKNKRNLNGNCELG